MQGISRFGLTKIGPGDEGGADPEARLRRRREAPPGADFQWLTCKDGASIRMAFWEARESATGAGRGTILLLHGRREFIEKYYETIQDLLDRGFAVATFDWRGQGLSARPLEDRHRGHADDFATYLEDLDLFASAARQRLPGPFAILAHSFGGHCAVRYLHDHRVLVERAVLVAPMLGIHFGLLPRRLAEAIARLALRFGRAGHYAPAQGGYSPLKRRAEAIVLSSDASRLEDEIEACRVNPELALGGVTYGWLAAALQSIRVIHGPGYAEAIGSPVLTVIAGRDRVVDNRMIRAFASSLPQGELVEIADARHEILKERDELRDAFWAHFDRFMGL